MAPVSPAVRLTVSLACRQRTRSSTRQDVREGPSLGDDDVEGGREYRSDRLRRVHVPFARDPESAMDAQRQTGRDGIGHRLLCWASGTYRYTPGLARCVRGAHSRCIDAPAPARKLAEPKVVLYPKALTQLGRHFLIAAHASTHRQEPPVRVPHRAVRCLEDRPLRRWVPELHGEPLASVCEGVARDVAGAVACYDPRRAIRLCGIRPSREAHGSR
jgi:hypothetical protein